MIQARKSIAIPHAIPCSAIPLPRLHIQTRAGSPRFHSYHLNLWLFDPFAVKESSRSLSRSAKRHMLVSLKAQVGGVKLVFVIGILDFGRGDFDVGDEGVV